MIAACALEVRAIAPSSIQSQGATTQPPAPSRVVSAPEPERDGQKEPDRAPTVEGDLHEAELHYPTGPLPEWERGSEEPSNEGRADETERDEPDEDLFAPPPFEDDDPPDEPLPDEPLSDGLMNEPEPRRSSVPPPPTSPDPGVEDVRGAWEPPAGH